MKKTISREALLSALEYNDESGEFKWIQKRRGPVKVGQKAGSINHAGYVVIKINQMKFMAHVLVWFLKTGEWPTLDIDHINGIKTDNRFQNLRHVTRSVNLQNQRKAHPNNHTGLIGVNKKGPKKFLALIQIDGIQKSVGTFENAIDAHNAYIEAKRKGHPGNTL
ncbi:HNH endonuclease signature motif containing protein [Limnobacter sp. P1]|uniref:HNH endonuclease signature motif containing protein n=1 Tax=Limnobacter olei TaxID=3031298 RepID=UPI0023AEDF2F|nr:HNH endonuclease signature motif containing protein [Limnobacter sp. P1]